MVSSHIDNGDNVVVSYHRLEADRPKAYRFTLSASDCDGVWIPKSQVAHIDEDAHEIWIPLWLAEKKGLEYD